MREKIKTFIAKIKLRIKHNKCYSEMEGKTIAVFGMCSGKRHLLYIGENESITIPAKLCSVCPYFREVKEGEQE